MATKIKSEDFTKAVKANLIELGEGKKVTNVDAVNAVKAVKQAVIDALVSGENVGLQGLGTLELRQRGERAGRNPQTGEEITIPARTGVGFKPADSLKKSVKGL